MPLDGQERTEQIIGSLIEVYRHLGPGLLVNFYSPKVVDGIKRLIN